ncbi:putative transcriptional regulator [Reichenbachiella agariperforans]|uniref:Putative transcriptional regulator n=1 Tax=Reichenbachiella agariperforans TaxID=156994 RepID=A0A1M6KRE0_REIAG|nr:YqgE/AlgH family protein [Reichenbachiella agariperforans]SHJ61505.1 putative transcriptional regulator [Reichenbachiella agariperforans]
MDYFHSKRTFQPEKGDLLISEPYLPDPNFERTVILICSHGTEGSFGFVLNKEANLRFDEAILEAQGFEEKLYVGGPVQQDTLHFIHRSTDETLGGQDIGGGLYWSGDYDRLMEMIKVGIIDPTDFRFFVGYSGWDAGQLEEELEAKSWIVHKGANAKQILDTDTKELWKVSMSELGGKFKMFANYPTDPKMN